MDSDTDRNVNPKVGEVWIVNLSNAIGHQQSGIRPFVVMSNNKRNLFSTTVKGVPMSSRVHKNSPVHVLLKQEDCPFLKCDSIVLCEEVDTINKSQFIRKIGTLTPEQMAKISEARLLDEPFLLTAFLNGIHETSEFKNFSAFA